jgi:hypothetical protein
MVAARSPAIARERVGMLTAQGLSSDAAWECSALLNGCPFEAVAEDWIRFPESVVLSGGIEGIDRYELCRPETQPDARSRRVEQVRTRWRRDGRHAESQGRVAWARNQISTRYWCLRGFVRVPADNLIHRS